ncbi:MAG: TetR family transcriptional regulator, partial [Azonexus sp.]|nr:TetR family transcriptional regulator [Azonexus sp.]
KIESRYQLAAERGALRARLDPLAMARDTWAFTSGLLHLFHGSPRGSELEDQIPDMIAQHMALRRNPE